jgi:hypothetical protein
MKQSRVISARVPVDVADLFNKACKQKGLTKSSYMVELMSTPGLPMKMKGGGEVASIDVPEELKEILTAVGGVGIGFLVFKIITAYMPKDKYTKNEINVYAAIGAVAAGFASAYGINKLMNEK